MRNKFLPVAMPCLVLLAVALAASCLLSACKTSSSASGAAKAIRINAGAAASYTDPAGRVWLPDQGFAEGTSVDRGNIDIAGTKNPVIYRTEHYGMATFSHPVPNGAYTVKLHFAETYSGVTAKGQRVFSIKIQDQEIKDLDILARAGAPRTAWVESIPVTVTDGKLTLTFTPGVQRPAINGIEILPR